MTDEANYVIEFHDGQVRVLGSGPRKDLARYAVTEMDPAGRRDIAVLTEGEWCPVAEQESATGRSPATQRLEPADEDTQAFPADLDDLGRLVRQVWVEWALEQPDPKPSWLVGWEDLPEADRAVDRRIGLALFLRGVACSGLAATDPAGGDLVHADAEAPDVVPALIAEVVRAWRTYERTMAGLVQRTDAAEVERDVLAANVAAAKALHPNIDGQCFECDDGRGGSVDWPCRTRKTLETDHG